MASNSGSLAKSTRDIPSEGIAEDDDLKQDQVYQYVSACVIN